MELRYIAKRRKDIDTFLMVDLILSKLVMSNVILYFGVIFQF